MTTITGSLFDFYCFVVDMTNYGIDLSLVNL